jgi:hypothetical protein
MNKGKDICKELKALRRRIAEENGIPLETDECTYRGECCGTCPRCDAEVRYLEDALSHRLSLGKAATVAGLALGLAVGAGVQAQNVTDTIPLKPLATEIPDTVGKVRVTGVVLNSKTKEPEPFVHVSLKKNAKMITDCATNYNEGKFVLEIPLGEYDLVIDAVGFKQYEKKINITEDLDMGVVSLEPTTRDLQGVKVEKVIMEGLIDKGGEADPPDAEYNVNGVKVIVR